LKAKETESSIIHEIREIGAKDDREEKKRDDREKARARHSSLLIITPIWLTECEMKSSLLSSGYIIQRAVRKGPLMTRVFIY
jgi:hypothetical protein